MPSQQDIYIVSSENYSYVYLARLFKGNGVALPKNTIKF